MSDPAPAGPRLGEWQLRMRLLPRPLEGSLAESAALWQRQQVNSLFRSFSSGFLVMAFFGVSSVIAEELTNATASLALTNVPWPAGAKVSVPQFDPALGTLQLIKIELRSRARTFGTLLNLSTLDQTVFVTVESSIAIRTGTRLLVEGHVTGVSATADVPAGEITPSPTANGTAVRNGTVPNDFAIGGAHAGLG